MHLREAGVQLLRENKPFTQKNLTGTYEVRRRASWVEDGVLRAAHGRDGFQRGFIRGLFGMALAGITNGVLTLNGEIPPAPRQLRQGAPRKSERVARKAATALVLEDGGPLPDALLRARVWP